MEIDHIIPESLLGNPDRLAYILNWYGLPKDFDINSYANWLPASRNCNRKKSNSVFDPGGAILSYLEQARKNSAKCEALERKCLDDEEAAKILNEVERAFDLRAADLLVQSEFNRVASMDANFSPFKYVDDTGNISISIVKRNKVLSVTEFEAGGQKSIHSLLSTFGDTIANIDASGNVNIRWKPSVTVEVKFTLGFATFRSTMTYESNTLEVPMSSPILSKFGEIAEKQYGEKSQLPSFIYDDILTIYRRKIGR
ncbi:hypothetical protein [Mesorhizobium sp. 43Arga]